MIIKKFIVSNFLPMSHAGPAYIEIDCESVINIIIGNNGSGKSSLLGEMNPFPAISTMYGKDGYKKAFIEDLGNEYIIESRFEGKSGIHCFIKNGVELNESHTSTVQTELCRSEFGLTDIIKKITSGRVSFCNASRVERKELLLACYPSNLLFVLNYHKQICSKLRSTKANLNMLAGKKLELEEMRIPNESLELMEKMMADYLATKQAVETLLIQLDMDIATITNDEQYSPNAEVLDLQEMSRGIELVDERVDVMRDAKWLFTKPTKLHEEQLQSEYKHQIHNLQRLDGIIHDTLVEIDEIEALYDSDRNDRITKLKKLLSENTVEHTAIKNELGQFNPIPPKLDTLLSDELFELVYHIAGCDVIVPNEVEYANLVDKLNSNNISKHLRQRDMEATNNELTSIQAKLASRKEHGFRLNCELACPAREDNATELKQLSERHAELIDLLTKQTDELHSADLIINKYQTKVDTVKEYVPSLVKLERVLYELGPDVLDYVLDTCSSIGIAIKQGTSNVITKLNTLNRYCELSTKLSKLDVDIEKLSHEINILEQAVKRVSAVSEHSITKHNDRIKQFNKEREQTVDKKQVIESKLSNLDKLSKLETTFEGLQSKFKDMCMPWLLNQKLTLLSEFKEYATLFLRELDIEIGTVRSELEKNKNILIRLNDEIVPSLEEVTKEHGRLSILERTLSPTTGIPHCHMVDFINNIIEVINEDCIKNAWSYPMKLIPLSTDNALTFDFKVKVNKGKELNDIRMLSLGQAQFIDLAFNIALYVVKELNERFALNLDEPESAMTDSHKVRIMELLATLMNSGDVQHMNLVSHNQVSYSLFQDTNIICLNPEGIVLPLEYNKNVTIK